MTLLSSLMAPSTHKSSVNNVKSTKLAKNGLLGHMTPLNVKDGQYRGFWDFQTDFFLL